MTKIEWTDETWICVTGCTKTSIGCANCYAERMTKLLQGLGNLKYAGGFNQVVAHWGFANEPLRWKKPKRIFVNSMSDTFHGDVLDMFIYDIFATMRMAHWHQFQVLTKRSERLVEMDSELRWMPNIWMGVSVEREDYLWRLDDLNQTGAEVKFVSFEPLLGAMPRMDLTDIHWVIVGCESGPGARPMNEDWVRGIRDQCIEQGVAFFYKQRMDDGKKVSCPELDKLVWDQYPDLANLSRVVAQPSLF